MERFGRLLLKSAKPACIVLFLVVAPLVAHSHAAKQQAAAREKWGSQLNGKLVKFTSATFGDAGLPVRLADIKFTGHNGEPVTVNRVVYYTNKVGEPFGLWQAKDGTVFVNGDQGATGSWSWHYMQPLAYRNAPWPTTQGTYFWRFAVIGVGGSLIMLMVYHFGCWLEETAHKRRRNNLAVAA